MRKLIEEPRQKILSLLEHPINAYLHILKALTIKASLEYFYVIQDRLQFENRNGCRSRVDKESAIT